MTWIRFNPKSPRLPRERKNVLVAIAGGANSGGSPSIVVGYLRRWSGRNNFFVTPGVSQEGRIVTHFNDCLEKHCIPNNWNDLFIERR